MSSAYDVLLDDDGDLPVFCRLGTGRDVIVQRVRLRLRTFLGEYLLDTTKGLDMVGWTQRKPPQVEAMGALIRAEILGVPGVKRVERFSGSYDIPTQRVTYTGQVFTDDEDELELTVAPLGRGPGNRTPYILLTTGKVGPIVL